MENGSSGSPPPATTVACPSPTWVMLNRHPGSLENSTVAEAKTTSAASMTSTNLLFHVSLLLEQPPEESCLHYYGPCNDSASSSSQDGDREDVVVNHLGPITVIGAHGGAVLLKVRSSQKGPGRYDRPTITWDYFLYQTGTAARLRPSLLKLPGCYFPRLFMPDEESQRIMGIGDTGLLRLRCCDDEEDDDEVLLVAQIEVPNSDDKPRDTAELCVLCIGQDWELKQDVPIIFGDHQGSKCDDDDMAIPQRWQADRVVPVGDRFLCWVDYLLGILFYDMATIDNNDASVKFRYVPLPVVPPKDVEYWDDRPYMRYRRDLAGESASAVRFVSIDPRCCCGSHGRSACSRGHSLFIVTTWTLRLSVLDDQPLEWVKDGVFDCGELWALPAYSGLPQVTVKDPIVSLDNPDVIWFVVEEDVQDYTKFRDRRVWMIEVDTRSKTLLPVVPYTNSWGQDRHIAAKLHW